MVDFLPTTYHWQVPTLRENHHEVEVQQSSKSSTQQSSDEQEQTTPGQVKEAADIEIIKID